MHTARVRAAAGKHTIKKTPDSACLAAGESIGGSCPLGARSPLPGILSRGRRQSHIDKSMRKGLDGSAGVGRPRSRIPPRSATDGPASAPPVAACRSTSSAHLQGPPSLRRATRVHPRWRVTHHDGRGDSDSTRHRSVVREQIFRPDRPPRPLLVVPLTFGRRHCCAPPGILVGRHSSRASPAPSTNLPPQLDSLRHRIFAAPGWERHLIEHVSSDGVASGGAGGTRPSASPLRRPAWVVNAAHVLACRC